MCVCGDRLERTHLSVPGFSVAAFEGPSEQLVGCCAVDDPHPSPPMPTSQLLPSVPCGRELRLSPLGLRRATRDPGRMGVGRGSRGGCQFRASFPAGSVIPPASPYFGGRNWLGLNLRCWRRRGRDLGLLFFESSSWLSCLRKPELDTSELQFSTGNGRSVTGDSKSEIKLWYIFSGLAGGCVVGAEMQSFWADFIHVAACPFSPGLKERYGGRGPASWECQVCACECVRVCESLCLCVSVCAEVRVYVQCA